MGKIFVFGFLNDRKLWIILTKKLEQKILEEVSIKHSLQSPKAGKKNYWEPDWGWFVGH